MNKLAIGIAGALVLAMALSGTTTAATLPADHEGTGFEVDNPFICSAPSTAEALLTDTGNALPATCDNGEYQRTTSIGISHGFTGVPYAEEGWTGHFESWLIHDGDDRGFRCTFEAGTLVACAGLGGSFPGMEPFAHECRAFESGTGLELPIAAHDWGCAVSGNIEPVA